ncbi:MAG: type II toxin-antitoxin system HicB family antitoxin [Flavobacteriales bacterium]|nr:type II toxin-antitoxin system HicB family antitoxin [Flavobacteriales bacterium]
MKKYQVIVENTGTGFSAYFADHPVFTTGNTLLELRLNLVESMNLYLEEEGKTIRHTQLMLELDLGQFFRHYRVLNANFLAERIGMNPALLSQYVRGRRKPTFQQTERIIQGIRQIGKELHTLQLSVRN